MNDYNTKWIFERLGIEPNEDFQTDIDPTLTCKIDENLEVFIKDDEGNYNCPGSPYTLIGILKGDIKILKNKNIKEEIKKDAIEYIEYIPTTDVQEVKHGHYDRLDLCSECRSAKPTKSNYDFIANYEVRFCYFCGAKMDKE